MADFLQAWNTGKSEKSARIRFLVNYGMFLDNLSAWRYFTLSSNLK